MKLHFRLSKDAEYIARMNKTAQELHYTLYHEYFKPSSYNEIVEFLKNNHKKNIGFVLSLLMTGKMSAMPSFIFETIRKIL